MSMLLSALRPRLCRADLKVLVNLLRYPRVPDLHSHLSPLPINCHDGHMHLHGIRNRSVVASKMRASYAPKTCCLMRFGNRKWAA